jgi:hypothetical protein
MSTLDAALTHQDCGNCQVTGGGEAAHVGPDLGDDDRGGDRADAGISFSRATASRWRQNAILELGICITGH